MPTELTGKIDRAAVFMFYGVIASLAFSISLFEISCWTFIGLSVLSMGMHRKWDLFRDRFFIFAGLFFAANILSASGSAYPGESLQGIGKVLRNVLLCGCVLRIIDGQGRLKRVYDVVMGVAIVIGLDALAQGLIGRDLIRMREMTPFYGQTKRLTATFPHANDFGAYLSFVTPLFLGGLFWIKGRADRRRTAALLAGFCLMAACLVGTYSRGAWLAVGGGALFLALMSRNRWALALMAAASLWLFFLSPELVRSRALSLFDSQSGTIVERKILWKSSLRMIEKNPWTGLGVNTYSRNEPLFKDADPKIDSQYAHNGYLQIAAETGLLGLGAFLLMIAYWTFGALSVFMRKTAGDPARIGMIFVGAALSFLLHSATDTNLQSVLLVNLLWFGFAVVLAAQKLAARAE